MSSWYGIGSLCMRSGCEIVSPIRMFETVDKHMNGCSTYLLEACIFYTVN